MWEPPSLAGGEPWEPRPHCEVTAPGVRLPCEQGVPLLLRFLCEEGVPRWLRFPLWEGEPGRLRSFRLEGEPLGLRLV